MTIASEKRIPIIAVTKTTSNSVYPLLRYSFIKKQKRPKNSAFFYLYHLKIQPYSAGKPAGRPEAGAPFSCALVMLPPRLVYAASAWEK